MKNQNEALLKYLVNHAGITTWAASDRLGISCLHKRIAELEQDGHDIHREWLSGKNRYGNPSRVMRYKLK